MSADLHDSGEARGGIDTWAEFNGKGLSRAENRITNCDTS